ncbi:MAG: hypothetical protein AAFN92_03070, partial [Bacteroidota bacterium]
NPAGLAGTEVKQFGAGATAEQRFGHSELTLASLGATYGTNAGGFGLQLASFGFDTYRENQVGLAYGRRLSQKFTIGAEFTGFETNTE